MLFWESVQMDALYLGITVVLLAALGVAQLLTVSGLNSELL